jgi:hypothetical protein
MAEFQRLRSATPAALPKPDANQEITPQQIGPDSKPDSKPGSNP